MNTIFSVEVRRSADWARGGSIGIVVDPAGREVYRTKPCLQAADGSGFHIDPYGCDQYARERAERVALRLGGK